MLQIKIVKGFLRVQDRLGAILDQTIRTPALQRENIFKPCKDISAQVNCNICGYQSSALITRFYNHHYQ